MSYENLLIENHDAVRLIRFNRPKALNALNGDVMRELGEALKQADGEEGVGCIVLTGSERAFAAGADIKQMMDKSFQDVLNENFITAEWEEIEKIRTPIIAAVRGFALGGGCEVAMMCDFILCSDTAKFGQPEVTIGTIPGAGGTQRLTRLIGKSKAMDLVLTGRMMGAEEAERCGLVSQIFADDELEAAALKSAGKIASLSKPVTRIAKASVNAAYETTLTEGIRAERRLFYSTFALDDRREGMTAFAEKRKAEWQNR